MGLVNLFGAHVEPRIAFLMMGEIVVGVLLALAFIMAARHKGRYHHYMILPAFLADELVIKPLMYQRLTLGVFGAFPYPGTSGLPHILLAASATVLGTATMILGFKFRIKKEKKMFLPPKGKIHKIVGALYLVSWFATMLYGVRIFVLFYL
jgi:uncharacterized membrane protein YozB (DUF420 family)